MLAFMIPIDSMADMDFKNAAALPADELASMAARIRQVLVRQGHQQAAL